MEKRHRRPRLVTLAACGVFLLGAGYLLQSGQALINHSLYNQLPLSVPVWYQPLLGGLWGGLWLWLGIGLWRGSERARRLTLVVIPVQIVFWLADWWLFSRSTIAIQSFGFDFALRLAAAGIAAAILLRAGRWKTAGSRAAGRDLKRESKPPHVE